MLCWFLPYSLFPRRSDMLFGDEGKQARLALLIETNVWQVGQLKKHDNRIDPQEAPTRLLFRKFLNLQRYTVVAFSK